MHVCVYALRLLMMLLLMMMMIIMLLLDNPKKKLTCKYFFYKSVLYFIICMYLSCSPDFGIYSILRHKNHKNQYHKTIDYTKSV